MRCLRWRWLVWLLLLLQIWPVTSQDTATQINPLTGLPLPDNFPAERRPIVAKISNAPPLVRPQAGISSADIVYEHYAEGGLTRFSAVFYSEAPTRIGSIRSARLIDYELAAMYEASLVFSGASTGVEERIYGSEALGISAARQAEGREIVPPSDFAERAYKGVLYGRPYYFRDEAIPVPHNLFASPSAIWELAASEGNTLDTPLTGMTFDDSPPAGATGPADELDIRYRATRVQWFYDKEAGQYKRMSDGRIHTDALTQAPLMADNVVVIYADHTFTDIVESEWQGNKSYSIEVRLWFEGDALLARNGQWYDARWIRPTRESLISLTDHQGEPLAMKPGQTWFQVVRLPEQQESISEWVEVHSR